MVMAQLVWILMNLCQNVSHSCAMGVRWMMVKKNLYQTKLEEDDKAGRIIMMMMMRMKTKTMMVMLWHGTYWENEPAFLSTSDLLFLDSFLVHFRCKNVSDLHRDKVD